MENAQYNVVFCGEIAAGQEIQNVKQQLSKLFQIPAQRIDALFSGNPIIVKANADHQTALRYQNAFQNAGAICRLEPVQADTTSEQPLTSQPNRDTSPEQPPTYDVMFAGQILEGNALPEVKQRLIQLFKTDANTVEGLFSGKSIVIRAQVDRQTALQYNNLMERAGAVCQLVPHQPTSASAASESSTPPSPRSSELPVCPKCNYQAKSPNDPLITGMGGMGECPSCGIIVANYRKVMQQKAEYENLEMKKQAEAIVSALKTFLPREGVFIEPDIPSKKLLNAKQSCRLPRYENPVGLIDCTVTGSAKNGLVFGMKGIYYHNDWAGKKPGNTMLPYRTFAKHLFTAEGSEVVLGEGHFLNCAGAPFSASDVAGMLNAVGDALYLGRDPSGVVAEEVSSLSSSEVSKKSDKGGFFAPEKKGLEKGAVGGLVMMAIAAVWFIVGYKAGYIFYYPPILFVIGLFGSLKGLLTGNISGK